MRRTLFIIIALLATVLTASAQKGLHVNEVFDGDIVEKTYMVENIVKGQQLQRYGLSYFRSIKFKASEDERQKIERLVELDMKNSFDLEQERKVASAGKNQKVSLVYAIMTLPPEGQGHTYGPNHWYLCYQCAPYKKQEYAITLVFMEGTASIEKLRTMFNQKK